MVRGTFCYLKTISLISELCRYFIKNKSEVPDLIEKFFRKVKSATNCAIRILRLDNGREYVNRQVESFLEVNGVRHKTTVPYRENHPNLDSLEKSTDQTLGRSSKYCSVRYKSLWPKSCQRKNSL